MSINVQSHHDQSRVIQSVNTQLRYMDKGSSPAMVYLDAEGPDGEKSERLGGEFSDHPVTIHNARLREKPFTLQDGGFMLAKHQTAVKDFHDGKKITDIYEQELSTLLKKHTGGNRVEIFDHTLRSSSKAQRQLHQIREPVNLAHNDYSSKSGPRRLAYLFRDDPSTAAALMKGNYGIYQVWRSTQGPILNHFLALCDGNTLNAEDLISVPLYSEKRVGEVQHAHFNPKQSWYYYPDMQMDEALIFKTFDSTKSDGRNSLHTGFVDPNISTDVPPRQSIESRCFVFFE